jgi:MATE family multidrug resistance protein
MIPLGLSAATAITIGNKLGANKPHVAKRKGWYSSTLSIMWIIVIAVLFTAFREQIFSIFTEDPRIIEIINEVWTILIIFLSSAIFTGIFQGIIRGTGLQARAWFASIIGYYIFGIPTASILVFSYGFQLYGIYIGMMMGNLINLFAYIYIVYKSDF